MSKYTVTLDAVEVFHNGMTKFIKCPCDCTGVTDIVLRQASGEVIGTFTICDANGDTTHDVGNVWRSGQHIMVRFDLDSMSAQVLNGANSKANAAHKNDKNNPHEVKASQVEVGENVETALGLGTDASVEVAFLTLAGTKCSIASGAYVGHLETTDAQTGVEIEFPFKPKMVICMPSTTTKTVAGWIYTGGGSAMTVASVTGIITDGFVSLTFKGNTATLGPAANSKYFETVSRNGVTYRWVAFA